MLSKAVRDYALVGEEESVRSRIDGLGNAGVDRVVDYPAAGIEAFLG